MLLFFKKTFFPNNINNRYKINKHFLKLHDQLNKYPKSQNRDEPTESGKY